MGKLIKIIFLLIFSSIYAMESAGEIITSPAAAAAGGGSSLESLNNSLVRQIGSLDESGKPTDSSTVMRYARSIKIHGVIKLHLLDDYAKSKLMYVGHKFDSGKNYNGTLMHEAGHNHLLGRLLSIYSLKDSGYPFKNASIELNTDIFKELYSELEMPQGTPLMIDWLNDPSGSSCDISKVITDFDDLFFYRKNIANRIYHSETKFIHDYISIWRMYPERIVSKMVPHSAKTIYFSAMQLFSSLDCCDDCLSKLIAFKEEFLSRGQSSLAQAIKNLCSIKKISYGQEKHHSLLLFNSAFAYHGRSPEDKPNLGATYFLPKDNGTIYEHALQYSSELEYSSTDIRKGYFSSVGLQGMQFSQRGAVEIEDSAIIGNIATFRNSVAFKHKIGERYVTDSFLYSTLDIFKPKTELELIQESLLARKPLSHQAKKPRKA